MGVSRKNEYIAFDPATPGAGLARHARAIRHRARQDADSGRRDYQEVLEHMGIGIPSGRSETEKAAFRIENERRLLDLFDWSDETRFRERFEKWKHTLNETAPPSSAGPVVAQSGPLRAPQAFA